MPTPLTPPDPDTLVLCQITGLEAPLLRRLLVRWATPDAILRAPAAALRAAGLPPALVARIVAAPRHRAAIAAGLQSLARMGIVPLPLVAPAYPARLRDSPNAPVVLYVQGRWPPVAPLVALSTDDALDAAGRAAAATLLAALHAHEITVMAAGGDLSLLPATGCLGVLPAGLLQARTQVPEALRTSVADGAATLLSVAPITAPATSELEAAAAQVLQALADGLVVAGRGAGLAVARPDLHQWHLRPAGTARAGRPMQPIPGGAAGAARIVRALGIRGVGTAQVQQERLW